MEGVLQNRWMPLKIEDRILPKIRGCGKKNQSGEVSSKPLINGYKECAKVIWRTICIHLLGW